MTTFAYLVTGAVAAADCVVARATSDVAVLPPVAVVDARGLVLAVTLATGADPDVVAHREAGVVMRAGVVTHT